MASTVITAPELHEETEEHIRAKLLEYVPLFRQHMDRGAGDLIGNLESIIEHKLWARVGFDSLEAYAREHLRHSEAWCHEVIRIYNDDWSPEQRQRRTVADLVAMVGKARAQVDPESDEYVKPKGRKAKDENGSTTTNSERHSKPGILRRLARERPDLLDRIEEGELSAHAAAVEAGFRKPMRSIPVDSCESAIKALTRVFSLDEIIQTAGQLADA